MSHGSCTTIEVVPFRNADLDRLRKAVDGAFGFRFSKERDAEGHVSLYADFYDGWLDDIAQEFREGLEGLARDYGLEELAIDFLYEDYEGGALEDGLGYHMRIERGEIVANEDTVVKWEPSDSGYVDPKWLESLVKGGDAE